ncbi:hypothetical protein [Alteribacillus iranensis]|uniref:hypothetical protein n=1 Tax=Alteribacillus iranensis TaxID=930128 RepID=UPI001C43404C|nr:hypothetical protein [Alteribacillus iranensis]
MIPKTVIRQDIKQTWMILVGLFIVPILGFPVSAYLRIERLNRSSGASIETYASHIEGVLRARGYSFWMILFVILLAAFFLGLERRNGFHDLSMTFPYKRSTLFLSKWVLGTGALAFSYIGSFLVAYAMFLSHGYEESIAAADPWPTFLATLIGLIGIFTFSLFVGTITGNIYSQLLLSVGCLYFPAGIFSLVRDFLYVHGAENLPSTPYWLGTLTMPWYVTNFMNPPLLSYSWIPLLVTLFSLIMGVRLYEKSPNEYNGEFLLFPRLYPAIQTGVILGAGLITGVFLERVLGTGSFSLLFYWTGFLLGGISAYLLIKIPSKDKKSSTAV